MKKGYLVGGLAIIGAIALIAYFKPKGKKTDKFVSASGGMRSGSASKKSYGVQCRRPNGSYYTTQAGQGYCTYSSDTIVNYGN